MAFRAFRGHDENNHILLKYYYLLYIKWMHFGYRLMGIATTVGAAAAAAVTFDEGEWGAGNTLTLMGPFAR